MMFHFKACVYVIRLSCSKTTCLSSLSHLFCVPVLKRHFLLLFVFWFFAFFSRAFQGVQRGDDLSGRFTVTMSPSWEFVLQENNAFAQIKNALAGNATVTFQVL